MYKYALSLRTVVPNSRSHENVWLPKNMRLEKTFLKSKCEKPTTALLVQH